MASVTINTSAKNFKVVLGHSPDDYDLALVSIDAYGTQGSLNSYVAQELGYDYLGVSSEQLSKGFHLLRAPDKKPILFVVTVGEGDSSASLKKNLQKALSANTSLLANKNIWAPLMATGTGGLNFIDSYNIILAIIKQFPDLFFAISISDDKRGNDFIKQFNIEFEKEEPSNPRYSNENTKNHFLGDDTKGFPNSQFNRFLQNGIWEIGINSKIPEEFDVAKKGDVIYLKSSIEKKSGTYQRIKAIGNIQNKLKDEGFSVNWIRLKHFVDIEGLKDNSFGRFSHLNTTDVNLIRKRILEENGEIFYPGEDRAFNYVSVKEYPIDNKSNFCFGQEVGEEIKDYDVIILPKSSYGGVGNNSISSHILKSLDIEKDSLNFSEENLLKHKYASFELVKKDDWQNIDKTFVLLFVVTRDESKNYIQFGKQLVNAIENFRKSKIAFDFIQERKNLRIFIPFLGTGQAGMPVEESYKNLLPGIRQLRALDTAKTIRINYPRGLDNKAITSFNEQILNEFNLEPHEQLNETQNDYLEPEFNNQDKIPFHLDQVVDEDKLGREPVAKAFVDLVKKDIFTDKLNYSFMVHLQGEWGSGKSSFLNFIKKHLNSNNDHWIVVDYNAWQNQHIDPPWWTLIDHIYRNSRKQLDFRPKIKLWFKESFRRIWRYTGWEKIVAFFVFSICTACIVFFGEDILALLSDLASSSEDSDKKENSLLKTLSDFCKLILTGTSLVGLLYTFSKFITVPFFINSSKEANSFVLRAADPMNKVKSHFNDLVEDINSKKKRRQLAIFIDDIDRCDKEFIVCLLEGIQTLFKEKRVLYIVAGDKNWITQSFGKVYKDFVSNGISENQLGEFFLEKAFQLSFRLPNISEEAKQNYWQGLLGVTVQNSKRTNTIEELTDFELTEVKQRIATSSDEIIKPTFMKEIEEEYNLSQDAISNLVIEEKNRDQTEIKHLLTDYHEMIDSNPRAIIRLANNYTMTRSTLIAERREFTEQKLFRWLAIEDLCPDIKNHILTVNDNTSIKEQLLKVIDSNKRENCLELFEGDKKEGSELTLEDIKQIKGL